MDGTGFDFADLVDEAVARSGGEQSTAEDVTKIRRGMRLLTERWTAMGYNTWRIGQTTAWTEGGVGRVNLSSDVDDVINLSSLRPDGTEAPLRRITATQYAQLASKWTLGEPSQYYLSRTVGGPQLWVYPTGPQNLRVWFVARPASYARYGDTTDDIPGRWLEALVAGIALDLAKKRPPYNEALIARLKAEALEAEDIAQRADRDRSVYRYRLANRRSS